MNAPRHTRWAALELEIIPIAVTGSPDHVEVVARYADGSYDRASGPSVTAALQLLSIKIADYLEGVDG